MDRSALLIAAVQMNSQEEVLANLAHVRDAVAEAAGGGARLVLLPENFAAVDADETRPAVAEKLDDLEGPIGSCLRELATKHSIWIIGGGIAECSDDPRRPYNTCAVVSPEGRLVARYRKIHLFDVELKDGAKYEESSYTMPGAEIVAVDIEGVRVGLSICYDLRFPELYRALVDRGVDLIVVPAAFTLATGKDHWTVLLQARAIESQSYVISAAQWGSHPADKKTFGKSAVIDPWGTLISQASEGTGVIFGQVRRERLEQVRGAVPSLRHRVLNR